MRILLLIGLAGLTLASGASDAEARGGRIRFGWPRARTPMPADMRATAPAPALAIRSRGYGDARPTYVVLPSPAQSTSPAEAHAAAEPTIPAPSERAAASENPAPAAPKALAEAAPWCLSRKVVGTGAGFCMVN